MSIPVIVTGLGILSSFCSLFLGVYAFLYHFPSRLKTPFVFLMIANALYAAAYTAELNSPNIDVAVWRLKIEFFGVLFVPSFWYLFADAFTSRNPSMNTHLKMSIFLIPSITAVLMWTNEYHGALYTNFRLSTDLGLSVLGADKGWWYWINTVYLYILLFIGTLKVVRYLSRSSGIFRTQTVAVLIGVLLPWTGHALLITGLSPFNLDISPFCLTVSGALMLFGIFKLQLFDIVPIAHQQVLEAIREGVIVLDAKNRFMDANRGAHETFSELSRFQPGDDMASFFESIGFRIPEELGSVELAIPQGDRMRRYRFDSRLICDRKERSLGTAIIVADITRTSELLDKLARLATTDALTGAHNRRHFYELALREMELARRNDRPVSLVMFDLDHFKLVNDRFGHAAGDAALNVVCDVCRSILRSSDIFCRYGGEEFVLLFPDADPEAAFEIAERLRKRIEEAAIETPTGSFHVTASFGVAGSFGESSHGLEEYLHLIDEALYRAKENGRNRVEIAMPRDSAELLQKTLEFQE